MNKHLPLLALAGFLFFTALPHHNVQAREIRPEAQTPTTTAPQSFSDLAERLLPTVVNISSTQKLEDPEDFPEMPQFPEGSPFEDFFDEFMGKRGRGTPSNPPASLGSGFVIDAEQGYIVTNNHVIRDAEEVRVTFHDDTTIEAEIIGKDEKTDLAVLKIDPKSYDLKASTFGNSDVMKVGDWVVAIGNPFGLGGTVTAGIISARQRDINSGPYDDFIQTDASINRGNSGGPMFNLRGEVIGINTAIFSPSGGSVGIGFAIPSSLAHPVIKQLIEYGKTRRGWLGVRIQTVTDEIAESLGLDSAHGALVASVTEDGPAENAKLQAGDIILSFNGKPVPTMRDLPRIVAETSIDASVPIEYWRDGKKRKSKVKVGELEKAEEDGLLEQKSLSSSDRDAIKIETVGMSVSALTDSDREEFSVPSEVEGVLITNVEAGSTALEKGLAIGDVIEEINQKPIKTPQDVESMIAKAVKANRKSVLLLINREGDVQFVALRLK